MFVIVQWVCFEDFLANIEIYIFQELFSILASSLTNTNQYIQQQKKTFKRNPITSLNLYHIERFSQLKKASTNKSI